jgi:uncharacterized protein
VTVEDAPAHHAGPTPGDRESADPEQFRSDGLLLAHHLARPARIPSSGVPGLVLCHGFPSGQGGGRKASARSYPELADRIATEMGWLVLAFNFRGCGASEGNFSIKGWLSDLANAVGFLRSHAGVRAVWTAGFGTGGALAVCAAADDPEVQGVAAVSAPADFDDWAGHPRRLLQHAREIGVITDRSFPGSIDQWGRELRQVRAVEAAARLAPRPLLLLHGDSDNMVPVFDARVLADAHGAAEMRIMDGAGHMLRHDPRAVAVLLGWLERQRNTHALRASRA